jgi:hypothetical protein
MNSADLKRTYQGAKLILYEHLFALHSAGVDVKVSDSGNGDGWLIVVAKTDDPGFADVLTESRVRAEAHIETPTKHLLTVDRILVAPSVASLFDKVAMCGKWEEIDE